jgi:hypothetical protein
MYAAEIAQAFNTANQRKAWSARPNSRGDTGQETVHFSAPSTFVTLVYDCEAKQFAVRFNKFHATWGDYVYSIARALHVVLSTLKASGLPFEAPPSPDGIEIVTTAAPGAETFVRWPGQVPMALKRADTPEA